MKYVPCAHEKLNVLINQIQVGMWAYKNYTRFPQYHNSKREIPSELGTPRGREIFVLNYNDHPPRKTL